MSKATAKRTAKPASEKKAVKPKTNSKAKAKSSTAGRKRVKFEIDAKPGCEVSVAGTFSDWKTDAYKLKDENGEGHYTRYVLLPKGRHEYKFVINGEWSVDPNCGEWAPNEHGTLNSIISVG